jgi:putative hydrolase of HD superfamily
LPLDFCPLGPYSLTMMDKAAARFLYEVGMLKKTPRTGYRFLGSGEESVAEHSFRTAVIGYVLASGVDRVDPHRVVLMCLMHDFHEARTDDHNYVYKRYVKVDERRAVGDMVKDLSFGSQIETLTNEFNAGETLEARLSKDADQLDLILTLKEQQDLGNPYAKEWLAFALKRLVTDSGKQLASEILGTDSTEWWFDRETDWWINGPKNQSHKS